MSLHAKLNRRFGRMPSGRERQQRAAARVDALRDALPFDLWETTPARRAGAPVAKVIVVGGGFAGMCAALALAVNNFEVVLYEARNRYGGRVLTLDDFATGRLIEGGAELIGLNHPMWLGFARMFGLGLVVLTPEADYEGAGLEMPLDGLPPEEAERVWEEMGQALSTLNAPAAGVDPYAPWTAPNAKELDSTPLSAWKDALKFSQACKDAVEADLSNNNAEPTARQSYLANLSLVAGGGGEAFWTDTEVFRCANGNQSLPYLIATVAKFTGLASFRPGTRVTGIAISDTGVDVRTSGGLDSADYVVLATPPSTWGTIAFDRPIPTDYMMNMGPVVKFLTAVRDRFWIQEGLAPSGMDSRIGETWEGTDNQTVADAQEIVLSVFAGGDTARQALAQQDPAAWYASTLDQVFPGYVAARQKTIFEAWPREPETLGGYSCPLPGQVTTVAPLLAQPFAERLVFAGEHACPAFFGYMEGALQSGVAAAGIVAAGRGLFDARAVTDALRAAVNAAA